MSIRVVVADDERVEDAGLEAEEEPLPEKKTKKKSKERLAA